MTAAPVGGEQHFLDLGREHIDAAQDDHVVGTPGDLLHAPHARPSGARQQPRQVAGAVADDRKCFLGQRGENEFALFAVGQHRAGFGIDHFRVEMILPDMQAVFGLDAFLRDAGPDHFGQAVDIGRVHVEPRFDLGAHRIGPGLGAEDAEFQGGLPWVQPLAFELVRDRQHVARRHRDDVGLEVVNQLNLPLGHAAGDRHHGAAQPLRAAMHAEAAGEQAIAIGVVDDHAAAAACGADRARHHIRPHVDIGLGVSDHDRLAGGAGRSMDADQFFARHREHAERVIVAQIGFHREWKIAEIGELPEIPRMYARFVEGLFVMRDVVVGVRQRPGEAFGLQRHDLVARRPFGVVQLGVVTTSPGLKFRRGHRASSCV